MHKKPKSYNVDLQDNYAFIRKVGEVAFQDATHPKVDEWADKLWIEGRRKYGTGNEARALFDFCQHKITYCKDPVTRDTIRMPHVILERYEEHGGVAADCDDKTCTLGALLMNRGYPVRFVGAHHIQEGENNREYREINHVYLQFKDDSGNWITLEPSSQIAPFGQLGTNVLPLYHVYANIGGERISKILKKKEKNKEVSMGIASQIMARQVTSRGVGTYIVSLAELNSYRKMLPTMVHPNFSDAYNEAYTTARMSGEHIVDIDGLKSTGKDLLKVYFQRWREIKSIMGR